jgi:hypothetical protein
MRKQVWRRLYFRRDMGRLGICPGEKKELRNYGVVIAVSPSCMGSVGRV